MCIGMKVDLAIKEAQEALENDMCVVIGLQSTGEARAKAVAPAERSSSVSDDTTLVSMTPCHLGLS